MKKRIFSLFFALLLLVTAAIPAFAAAEVPRLVDDAGLLSSREERDLLSRLDEISFRQGADIVVVTVDSLGSKTPMAYADDFYDDNGYGKDGVLLLVNMEDRDWWISTSGRGITAITDAGIEYISDRFLPDLSDGNYAEAFEIFADQCDAFITQAKTGTPYDVGHMPREPFRAVRNLIVALVVGFLIALIATGVMKGNLKSVRKQAAANSYVKANSLTVTDSRDLFLYTQVIRHARPKDSDSSRDGSGSHTSFSDSTHGGGGGKF